VVGGGSKPTHQQEYYRRSDWGEFAWCLLLLLLLDPVLPSPDGQTPDDPDLNIVEQIDSKIKKFKSIIC
jgi:hypothetical protein